MTLKGRDLVQGLPRQIDINSRSVCSAIIERVQSIVEGIRNVLEMTPPELSADIIDKGIVLTGGGALLRGLPELISRSTGIKCVVADHPTECVALGTGLALANIGHLVESNQGAVLFSARRTKR